LAQAAGKSIVRRGRVIIERPRLMKKLDESTARTILLLAPAGYGKTTLARQWRATLSRAVWLTLTPAHRDVTVIARDLADSLEAAGDEGFRDFIEQYIRARPNPQSDAALIGRVLADAINRTKTEWVIVDDYHDLGDVEEAHLLVETLLEKTSCRFMVASRTRPPWATARRKIYGDLSALGVSDLAMNLDEGRSLVGRVDTSTDALIEATEGWVAILTLIGPLGIESLPSPEARTDLHSYLTEEVFGLLTVEGRRRLVDLALIPEAGVKLDGLGLRDQEYLSVVLDDGRHIHPLVRDTLLQQLTETREGTTRVHDAITACLHANNWTRAFELISRFCLWQYLDEALVSSYFDLILVGRIWTLKRFVDSIPSREFAQTGMVTLVLAEVARVEGKSESQMRLARDAAHGLGDSHPCASRAHALVGDANFFLGRGRAAAVRFERARILGREPSDLAYAISGVRRTGLYYGLPVSKNFVASLRRRQHLSANERLRLLIVDLSTLRFSRTGLSGISALSDEAEAILPSVTDPNSASSYLHHHAYLEALRSRYDAARFYLRRLDALCEQFDLDFVRRHSDWTAAAVALGLRRLKETDQLLKRLAEAERRSPSLFHDLNRRCLLARFYLTTGRVEEALAEVTPERPGRCIPGMRAEYVATRALAYAISGQSTAAIETAAEADAIFSIVESRTLCSLAIAIASEEPQRPDRWRQAFMVAETLDTWDPLLCVLRSDRAFLNETLEAGLRPNLVSLCSRSGDVHLARSLGERVQTNRSSIASALSPREQEVLELLAQGLHNGEIARALFISESTVKIHVRHVYEKLGVRTRAQAAVLADLSGKR
jgi:LuxR family maltose regulon positive regulatory protein